MSLAIIVLLPVLAGLGFLYWANSLDEEQRAFKLMLQLIFLPLLFLSINLAVIDATILYGDNTDLVNQLAQFAYYLGWLLFLVGAFIIYQIVIEIINWFIQRKAAKESEKYD